MYHKIQQINEHPINGHMQVCTSLQTDNHASTPLLSFYRLDALPATQPTASKQDVVLKWQQQQPDHIQTIFTLLQTDNDTNFSSLNFQNTEHNVFGNIMA